MKKETEKVVFSNIGECTVKLFMPIHSSVAVLNNENYNSVMEICIILCRRNKIYL